jgi:hypothetical protein
MSDTPQSSCVLDDSSPTETIARAPQQGLAIEPASKRAVV